MTWQKDGVTRTIRYLVLAARWQGGSICAGAKLPVNIWYVLDDAVLTSESFESTQATFAAIGMVKIKRPSLWARLIGAGRIQRA